MQLFARPNGRICVVLPAVKAVLNDALIVFKGGFVFLPEDSRVERSSGRVHFFFWYVSPVQRTVLPTFVVWLNALSVLICIVAVVKPPWCANP